MRAIRKIMKIVIIGMVAVLVILAGSFTNHRLQVKKEASLFKPLGQLVKVNGNNMSVYTEGDGDNTLVFMSGGGTSSPILDFKSLYSQLSDDYKIVVIEKFGYGFSEIVDGKRDIATILDESRSALSAAGIGGPYILCPHSMSGIEALYWAQEYPGEVKAILGLDMAVPDAYSDYNINRPLLKLGSFIAQAGIIRFIPGVSESEAMKHGILTEEEKDIYSAVFYKRTASKTMLNEVEEIKNNAAIVNKGGIVGVPTLMFCSNGNGTGWDEEEWKSYQYDFIEQKENGELIYLDCSHYIHNHEYEEIAKRIREFIMEDL
ncbi:MAG TPA: alpha/beta hydrolase [Bacillota bacterium]|nr:alpha/beta hydrolase [Bacillota bacterium]